MSNNFRVSLSGELMILLAQLVFELQVVFNDAVVDHHHAPGAIAMWVSVFLGRAAMRRPTRVPQTVRAVEGLLAKRLFEIAELAFCAANLEMVLGINNRDARRIV